MFHQAFLLKTIYWLPDILINFEMSLFFLLCKVVWFPILLECVIVWHSYSSFEMRSRVLRIAWQVNEIHLHDNIHLFSLDLARDNLTNFFFGMKFINWHEYCKNLANQDKVEQGTICFGRLHTLRQHISLLEKLKRKSTKQYRSDHKTLTKYVSLVTQS